MKSLAVFLLNGVVSALTWAADDIDFSKPFTEAKMIEISQGDRDDYSALDFQKPFSAFRLEQIAEGDKDE